MAFAIAFWLFGSGIPEACQVYEIAKFEFGCHHFFKVLTIFVVDPEESPSTNYDDGFEFVFPAQ